MIFGKSRAEKDLDKILKDVNIATEQFTQATKIFTQTVSSLNITVGTVNVIFQEIRKQLEELNRKLDEYNKKIENLKPVGLNDVQGELKDIKTVLLRIEDLVDEISLRQCDIAAMNLTNIQRTLESIDSGIYSLSR